MVLVLSDSKNATYGHEIKYTVIDDVSNEKIHATAEFKGSYRLLLNFIEIYFKCIDSSV